MSLAGEAMLDLRSGHPRTFLVGTLLVAILVGGSLVAFRLARDLGGGD